MSVETLKSDAFKSLKYFHLKAWNQKLFDITLLFLLEKYSSRND